MSKQGRAIVQMGYASAAQDCYCSLLSRDVFGEMKASDCHAFTFVKTMRLFSLYSGIQMQW